MKKEKKHNNIIFYILMIIFCTMLIISGVKIFLYIKNGKEDEKIKNELSSYITLEKSNDNLDDTSENNEQEKIVIDFPLLKERNSDTIGYLKVNGTDIQSIVVRANDNNYYLTHNFDKKINNAGWIFADYHNKFDGSDKNIVIYGHNMFDNSMFRNIKKCVR